MDILYNVYNTNKYKVNKIPNNLVTYTIISIYINKCKYF